MQIYLKIKLLRVALEIFLQGSSYKDIFVETNKNNFYSKYMCICENSLNSQEFYSQIY